MKNVVEPALEYEINIELLHGAKNVLCYKIDEENGNPMKVWKEMGHLLHRMKEKLKK